MLYQYTTHNNFSFQSIDYTEWLIVIETAFDLSLFTSVVPSQEQLFIILLMGFSKLVGY